MNNKHISELLWRQVVNVTDSGMKKLAEKLRAPSTKGFACFIPTDVYSVTRFPRDRDIFASASALFFSEFSLPRGAVSEESEIDEAVLTQQL